MHLLFSRAHSGDEDTDQKKYNETVTRIIGANCQAG